MKIICKRTNLLKGIQMVKPAISTKGLLPILSNILLEAKENKLSLMATDLEVGIRCSINVEILEPGIITIPAAVFLEVVNQMPSEELNLKVEKDKIVINSKKTKFDLKGLLPTDYPVLTEFEVNEEFFMEQKLLNEMISKTVFSISQDAIQYILCGAYFQIENGKVKMVTTDARRFSCMTKNVEIVAGVETGIIIPKNAVVELRRILTQLETENKVKVKIGKSQISFTVNDIVLVSRLIEGNYPNYKKIIPETNEIKFEAKTKELLDAVRRVAILTNDRTTSIRWTLENNKLVVDVNAVDLGTAEDVIDINYNKEKIQIGFNPQFLIDVLSNINCEKVSIELSQSVKPCLIKPVDNEDYMAVVMPMRL